LATAALLQEDFTSRRVMTAAHLDADVIYHKIRAQDGSQCDVCSLGNLVASSVFRYRPFLRTHRIINIDDAISCSGECFEQLCRGRQNPKIFHDLR
jgi:hypothetical protein